MTAVERATEIILASTWMDGLRINPERSAQALADAGLLVSDELPRLERCARRWMLSEPGSTNDLLDAIRDYLASEGTS